MKSFVNARDHPSIPPQRLLLPNPPARPEADDRRSQVCFAISETATPAVGKEGGFKSSDGRAMRPGRSLVSIRTHCREACIPYVPRSTKEGCVSGYQSLPRDRRHGSPCFFDTPPARLARLSIFQCGMIDNMVIGSPRRPVSRGEVPPSPIVKDAQDRYRYAVSMPCSRWFDR
jgi:hypothetical protein